jgi:hypothetical protein
MGLEISCEVIYDGALYEPKVLLETEALIFRGALKKTIPFANLAQLEATENSLTFTHDGSPVEVRVGPKAAHWVEKIRNPRSLIDKLGVKHGETVLNLGVTDAQFLAQLGERTSFIGSEFDGSLVPWIFIQADTVDGLDRLSELRSRILSNGAIWVIHPKGRRDIQDLHVFAAAKAAGLVDVKVCAFSDTHSAIKLIIPRASR